ncbi:MAG TPA: pilin [Kofleriaceae bacterium]|nr:pilin [Kofleriaceae bacterium]
MSSLPISENVYPKYLIFQIVEQSTAGIGLVPAIGISIADLFPASLDADVSCHLHQSRRNSMKRIQQGFTLIELMIVVAIVGILAAIALPAYQDYVVRSKMSEAEAAVAACKTSVAEYLSTHATLGLGAIDLANSGCSTTVTQYVASLDVNAGVITAVSQNTGDDPCSLILTPSTDTTDTATIATWTGTHATCAAKHVPSTFR